MTGRSNRLGRSAIVGVSTGSALFVLLITALVIFCIWRWRKHRRMAAETNAATPFEEPNGSRPSSLLIAHEIGHQSVPELHDVPYQLELLDEQNPSGSGNHMEELPGGDRTSYQKLSATTLRDGDLLPSRNKSTDRKSIRNSKNASPQSRTARTSSSATQNIDPEPCQAANPRADQLEIQGAVKQPTKCSMLISQQANVHKALPKIPRPKKQSHKTHISLQHLRAVSKFAPTTTYATIFDLEDYRDRPDVSKAPIRYQTVPSNDKV